MLVLLYILVGLVIVALGTGIVLLSVKTYRLGRLLKPSPEEDDLEGLLDDLLDEEEEE